MDTAALKFWSDQAGWPRDGYQDGEQYVFLAHALMRIGAALFPGTWKGNEPYQVDIGVLPKLQEFASLKQQAVARMLLGGNFKMDMATLKYPPLTDAQWDEAGALAEQRRAISAPTIERWQKTTEATRSFLAQGLLPFALRYPSGWLSTGEPATIWNVDNATARFGQCAMRSPQGSHVLPIFALDKALRKLEDDIAERLSSENPTPANTLPHQWALKGYLTEAVKASPERRTLEYKRDILPWIKANAPSITERGYREIRQIVLEEVPGNKWGK